MSAWSLACTGCGKCCNSAPQMALPELFHHQTRFIGCLALRRIRVGASADAIELAAQLLHPFGASSDHLLLATHAYDDGWSGRCPALAHDGGCSVHFDRKPVLCAAVPLEPLLPDSQQPGILARRARDAAFLGANCLKPGAPAGSLPLLNASGPAPDARVALEKRRADLARDKRFWGDALYRTLPAELFGSDRVPTNGLLTLSIVPVVAGLARLSEGCRRRCREYVLAQASLIQTTLSALPPKAGEAQRELAAFAKSGSTLLRVLERIKPQASSAATAEAEAWLGT